MYLFSRFVVVVVVVVCIVLLFILFRQFNSLPVDTAEPAAARSVGNNFHKLLGL